MSLQDFTHTWVPVIQAAIGLLGLCSLGLVVWQIRRTNYWNRLNFLNNFTASSRDIEMERKLLVATKSIDIDLNSNIPLTEADVDNIWNSNSEEAFYAIKEYLSGMENLCVLIRIGAADPDIAYAVHSVRIISAHRLLEAFIKRMRVAQQADTVYIELEMVAGDFGRRQNRELAKRSK